MCKKKKRGKGERRGEDSERGRRERRRRKREGGDRRDGGDRGGGKGVTRGRDLTKTRKLGDGFFFRGVIVGGERGRGGGNFPWSGWEGFTTRGEGKPDMRVLRNYRRQISDRSHRNVSNREGGIGGDRHVGVK